MTLTEKQRLALEAIASTGERPNGQGRTVTSLYNLGLIEVTNPERDPMRVVPRFRLTEAGRRALEEEG